MAHDLNNVLRPILMGVQLLKMKNADAQSRSFLEAMETSAERGAQMVKQILSFARGAEGEHVLLQPRTVIKEVEAMLQRTLPKSIDVKTDVPKDIWVVSGDATQVY